MISFLFAVHILLSKVTALILEIRTVHRKYFREKTCLHLLLKLVYAIPVDEGPSPWSVSMEIQKCKESIIIIQMQYKITDCIDSRLKFHRWIDVTSVQIYSISINSVMAPAHTIRIQNRKDIEYEIISEYLSLFIILC